jgi:DNA-binding PadR family transcriptional regulator
MFTDSPQELVKHKLLILYILDRVDIPMTNSEITQFVLENNFMNYFMVQQFLSELVASKFIEFTTKDGNEYYHLSDAGKDTLNFFMDRIPKELKEQIDNLYEKKKEEMIKETQIISNYYKKNDTEYIVNLKVIEKDITLFNLSLNVVSNKQAKIICKNWKENPQYIYKKILDLLVNN